MIGSFISRGLVLIFGYAYPAYECFKTVELNKPEIEQLRFWCQYWILVAGLTVCERICDVLVGWVPMYGEAKLAFFIYLWYPKTKGTTYIYDSFFRPYMAKHETEIDRNLLELRTRAGDMIILYLQNAVSYGQSSIFQILQYVALHSSLPRVAQPQQQATTFPKSTTTSHHRSAPTIQAQDEQPPSPGPSTSSSENQEDTSEETETPKSSKASPARTTSTEQKVTTVSTVVETSEVPSSPREEQSMQNASVSPTEDENNQPEEILLEDAQRVTRARSRKTRLV